MAVITISREFGSSGDSVAHQVAKSLDYFLVDIRLIGRVLNQYGLGRIEQVIDEKHNIWDRYNMTYDYMIEMLTRTILAFASLDDIVILGRGGYVILNQYPNVLNVCFSSPFEKRVNYIIKSQELKNAEAEKLVLKKDQARESFLQTFYSENCKEYELFNLVIDTDKISTELASKWIVEATREISGQEIDPKQSTRGIEIDKTLMRAVLDAIEDFKYDQASKIRHK